MPREGIHPVLDQPVSNLPADLQAKGLLDQTLVVLGSDFGRDQRQQRGGPPRRSGRVPAGRGGGQGVGLSSVSGENAPKDAMHNICFIICGALLPDPQQSIVEPRNIEREGTAVHRERLLRKGVEDLKRCV